MNFLTTVFQATILPSAWPFYMRINPKFKMLKVWYFLNDELMIEGVLQKLINWLSKIFLVKVQSFLAEMRKKVANEDVCQAV